MPRWITTWTSGSGAAGVASTSARQAVGREDRLGDRAVGGAGPGDHLLLEVELERAVDRLDREPRSCPAASISQAASVERPSKRYVASPRETSTATGVCGVSSASSRLTHSPSAPGSTPADERERVGLVAAPPRPGPRARGRGRRPATALPSISTSSWVSGIGQVDRLARLLDARRVAEGLASASSHQRVESPAAMCASRSSRSPAPHGVGAAHRRLGRPRAARAGREPSRRAATIEIVGRPA